MAATELSLDYRINKLGELLYGFTGKSEFGLAAQLNNIAETKGEDNPEYIALRTRFLSAKTEYDLLKAQAQREFEEKKSARICLKQFSPNGLFIITNASISISKIILVTQSLLKQKAACICFIFCS